MPAWYIQGRKLYVLVYLRIFLYVSIHYAEKSIPA